MEFKTFFLYFLTSYFLCNVLFATLSIGLEQLHLYILKKKIRESCMDFLTLDDAMSELTKDKNKKTWN